MFDTYLTRRDTQFVDRNITHIEYRAPTDEMGVRSASV